MPSLRGGVSHGTDATGADTYATVIADPTGTEHEYKSLIATCATNAAMISTDGGVTDEYFVAAGGELAVYGEVRVTGAVQAKNANAGSNYTALHISIW